MLRAKDFIKDYLFIENYSFSIVEIIVEIQMS
jgi:hypothetical protein